MTIELQGVEVHCGDGHLAGRRVGSIVATNYAVASPEEGDVWVVVNEHHGDHDTDWIVVLREGFEVRRILLESCAEVEWLHPVA